MKVAFHTLGCKVNQYETESIKEQFEQAGYDLVQFNAFADIYIVNTCTVTNIADKKSRQMLKRPKKINDKALLVAVGCYVQRDDFGKDSFEGIDLVIGNTKKNQVLQLVEDYLKSDIHDADEKYQVEDINKEREYDAMWLTDVSEKTRAHLKVQDGCNQFCAYCIIPYVRGRIRSRQFDDVINEVNRLTANGFKEVVLTGIHLASYHDGEHTLIDLIEGIHDIDGIKRIRLGSLEPNLMTPAIIDRLKALDKVCPHFHLSLQSGCDRTLEMMNRKYRTTTYLDIVNRLKIAYDQPAFTTDVIVGFPGETDEDFNKTLDFVDRIGFMDLHVFKYSVREGTKAAKMDKQVDGSVKELRSKALIEIGQKSHRHFLDKMIGKRVPVLFEQEIKRDGRNYLIGHTDTYVKVMIKEPFQKDLLNQIADVHLKIVEGDAIIGQLATKL